MRARLLHGEECRISRTGPPSIECTLGKYSCALPADGFRQIAQVLCRDPLEQSIERLRKIISLSGRTRHATAYHRRIQEVVREQGSQIEVNRHAARTVGNDTRSLLSDSCLLFRRQERRSEERHNYIAIRLPADDISEITRRRTPQNHRIDFDPVGRSHLQIGPLQDLMKCFQLKFVSRVFEGCDVGSNQCDATAGSQCLDSLFRQGFPDGEMRQRFDSRCGLKVVKEKKGCSRGNRQKRQCGFDLARLHTPSGNHRSVPQSGESKRAKTSRSPQMCKEDVP